MRHKFALWCLLLLVGFLIGFILRYSRLQRIQHELSASTKQLESCQSSQQLAQLRDATTMMYLEVVQKNYGKAGEFRTGTGRTLMILSRLRIHSRLDAIALI
jgi:hypothetical protein